MGTPTDGTPTDTTTCYAQARALVAWYDATGQERGLPWRAGSCPLDVRAMAEGLLAQTTARAVADEFARTFAGIASAADWIRLSPTEKHARVAALGLPRMKVAAVSSIAAYLHLRDGEKPLVEYRGVGPYIAGMVELLLGGEAVPVDCNVQRVGGRVATDGDAERWIAAVLGAALTLPGGGTPWAPAGYRCISAVLDVGAILCGLDVRACYRCPLYAFCTFRTHYGEQLGLFAVARSEGDR